MSFWNNLAALMPWRRSDGIKDAWTTSQMVTGSQGLAEVFGVTGETRVVNEFTALAVTAIYACVNLIAGAISGLPMHVYRVSRDGERDRVMNDPLWWVINEEMTPRWSAANGWEFLALSLLLHGDAFAIIRRGPDGMPIGIVPVHPLRVTVALNNYLETLVYIIQPEPGMLSQKYTAYDQADVIHVAGFGFDGFRGLSPLRYALRDAAAVAMAAQEFSEAFFENSARPDFALTTEKAISQQAIEDMRKMLESRHQGAGKAYRPMILQGGLDIKTITMPAKDMELITTRQFQIEEIARIYGVPPFMIGHTEKTTSWGSGVEAMGTGFVRFALRQHLNKFETEFNRKLFRTSAKRVEFDTFDLERADMKSMFEAYRVAIGRAGEPGWMTAEEVRFRLNLKKTPDMGKLTTGATDAQPPQPSQA